MKLKVAGSGEQKLQNTIFAIREFNDFAIQVILEISKDDQKIEDLIEDPLEFLENTLDVFKKMKKTK